jgi:acetyl-CoA carboxylase biotin carboxyl carrier protein
MSRSILEIEMAIDIKELKELIAAIAATDISELSLKNDDFELSVRKDTTVVVAHPGTVAASLPVAAVAAESTPVAAPAAAAPTIDKKWVEIKSPMVGTFYRAPAPEEPPFVSVGDRIPVGQAICIIEAMKLMNELDSEVSGQVMEILAENGQPVEFGQILMYVNPS